MSARDLPAPDRLPGRRVSLRRSTTGDAAALFDAAHDAQVMRYLDWPAQMALGEAWAFLDASAQRWRDGSEYHWMVETASDAQPVGCIACRPRGHAVDFGVLLARAAWGHGYATEAAQLLTTWLQGHRGIHRIWAGVDTHNARAIALLERVGLRREGLLRRATVRPNLDRLPRDSLIYGLCRDDF